MMNVLKMGFILFGIALGPWMSNAAESDGYYGKAVVEMKAPIAALPYNLKDVDLIAGCAG